MHDKSIITKCLTFRIDQQIEGLPELEIVELIEAGFLHDIGKAKVPEEINYKPGKLTSEEFELIRNHTLHGFEMMKNTPGISYCRALVPLQHHEREDGSSKETTLIFTAKWLPMCSMPWFPIESIKNRCHSKR